MSGAIKGITVSIGGDVTGLNKALKDLNKDITGTQKELQTVERLLKLDPKNTELLAQKQKLMTDAVEATEKKLTALTKSKAEADKQMAGGTKVNEEQYRKLGQEIVATQESLKGLQKKAEESNSSMAKIGKSAEELGNKMTEAGKAFAPISAGAAAIAAGMVAAAETTREYRTDLAKLLTNAQGAGVATEEINKAMRELYVVTQETDSNVEGLSNLLEAGFTNNSLARAVDLLAGAVVRFPDTLKIESLSDSLQETLATGAATGQFAELLDRLGISVERFNSGLGDAVRSGTETNYVLKALAGQGLEETYQAYLKQNEALTDTLGAQYDVNAAMAQMGDAVEPIIAKVLPVLADLLSKVAGWLNKMDDGTLAVLMSILAIVAVASPLLMMMGQISLGVSSLTAVVGKLGPMLTAASGLFKGLGVAILAFVDALALPVVLIGALVVAIGVFGDELQAGLQKVDDYLQGVFATDFTETFGVFGETLNGFMAIFKGVWDGIKEMLDGVINLIRGAFTLNWERAWTGVKQIFSGVFKTMAEIVKAPMMAVIGLFNKVLDSLNAMIRGVNNIHINLPEALGGVNWSPNIPTIPKLPMLATGGILSRGSAIVGEAGPELLSILAGGRAQVTPLTTGAKSSAQSAIQEGNTVNIYNTFKVDDIATYVAIEQRMKNERQSYRQGYVRGL